MEEKLEIYLGHSVSKWACDWYGAKHGHPRGSWGKNLLRNSPVGACPEIVCMNRPKRTGFPIIFIKYLSLPSHALGRMTFLLFFSRSALRSAKGHHRARHSWMTDALLFRMRKAIVMCGAGKGPTGEVSAALSASSLISKPK